MSTRDILRVVFEHRALVLTIFFSTVLTTCLWLWLRADRYETSARVLIKFARDTADPRTSLSPDTARVAPTTRPDINTEAELIRSYALVERVVTSLHLDRPAREAPPDEVFSRLKYEMRRAYRSVRTFADEVQVRLAFKERLAPREQAIVELIRGLKVESVKDSSIVKISLTSRIKPGAGSIVNTLLGFYREQRLAVERNPAEVAFFQQQAEESKEALRRTEQLFQDLKRTQGVTALDEQLKLTLANLMDVERQAKDTAGELAAGDAKAGQLRAQMQRMEPRQIVSEISERRKQLDFLEERKAALELERQQLLTRYTEDHALLKDLAQRVTSVESLIAAPNPTVAASRTVGVNPVYQTLEQELLATLQQLDAARAKYASQQRAIASYHAQLETLRTAEPAYRQLTREIAAGEQIYRLYQNNSEEAKAAEALNSGGITSIEIVDAAVDPILPNGLRKTYIAGGAVVVGLILAVSFAFISDALNHTVRHPENVEDALHCPVLVSIRGTRRFHWPPDIEHLGPFLEGASRLDALISGGLEPGLGSRFARSAARTAEMQLVARRVRARTVACVAANSGAGATVVTAGLARALGGEMGKKTLIIELGRDESPLARMLSTQPIRGAVTIGDSHWDKAVVEFDENVSVLPAAIFRGGLTEQQIASLVSYWADLFSRYEYILLDASAGLAAHERAGVIRGCTGVVMVAEAGRTRREALERFRAEGERDGATVLGVVLNKRKFPIPEWLYRLAV